MRFEYIVLLIIAFNVITAVMQRRAKKARAEAQQRAAGQGGMTRQSAPKPFEVENDEGEEEEEWGGEYRDPYAGRDSVPATTSRRPGSDVMTGGGASRGSGDEPMQMPSMGRDILDQLARDLGLKIPKPAPRPVPVEARPTPVAVDTAAATRSARETALETVRAERVAEREMERERLQAFRTRESGTRETAAVARAVTGPVLSQARSVPALARIDEAARSRTAPGASPLRLNLSGPERLREAFVLKEILDLPISRRRRGA